MSEEQTYQERYNKAMQREHQAFEADEQAKLQAQVDFNWQCKLDAEAALRAKAEWDDSTGHRARRDSDWHLR